MSRLTAALLVALLAALLAAGCAGDPGSSTRRLTVLAAASLTEALDGFPAGGPATYSFAGSQQLVAQVEAGAPADVVATADDVAMDRLVRAGLVEEPVAFAANRLAIAVEPGNPLLVRGLDDLGRPDLKVVLADPSVPAGRYARAVLDRAGVEARPVSLELDVKAVARKVADGEADAGIVYATDLYATDVGGGAAVAIPDEANVTVVYSAAVVRASARRDKARGFVDRLLGPAGRRALGARGFGPP